MSVYGPLLSALICFVSYVEANVGSVLSVFVSLVSALSCQVVCAGYDCCQLAILSVQGAFLSRLSFVRVGYD